MADWPAPSTKPCFSFGPFRLFPARQLLLEGETPVRLGSRAVEILAGLVERPGELVSRDELVARVWPNTIVEESNLKVNVAALRRALGEGRPGRRYIATVSGRGYRFVAPVELSEPGSSPALRSTASGHSHNLPVSLTRTIGRADAIDALLEQLPRHRLVAVVGPAGIGKTTVAVAAAETLITAYEHAVRFVDLAPLGDPQFVPSAVASALGLAIRSDDVVAALIAYLQDKQMLVVLDNCEHVIEATAFLAERILSSAPDVQILATSRERLRVKGEQVHRLSPLVSPPVSSGLTSVQALTFPAIQLFVERAAESLEGFELSDSDAPIVAEICRKLEGIALAIELAASRIDAFGVRELSTLLEDRFQLLKQGRRTALPRHRTLAAALDWSYEILPEYERTILRRLGVFAGPFTLESASAVAADSGTAAAEVVERVANLAVKSLVSADVSGAVAHYRLLDTTRAYALGKLKEAGEDEQVARLHAEFFRDKFVAAAIGRSRSPSAAEMHEYVREIDNVRSAIDWSFSNGAEPAIGVALTVAFSPVWLSLSLMAELRDRAQHALRMKDVDSELSDPREQAERELDLQMALGPALVATKLHGHPDIGQTYARAWELCQQLGDHSRGFTALRGLQVYHQNLLEMEKAQHFAEEALRVAERLEDPARLVGGHMAVGGTLYWQGKLEPALAHFRRGFELSDPDTQFPDWPGSHPGLQCQLYPMLISWMLGYPDRSLDELRAVIESAETLGHPVTLARARCHAALVHSFRHEPSAVADHAERALRICEERRIESLRGPALCPIGWALGVSGECASAGSSFPCQYSVPPTAMCPPTGWPKLPKGWTATVL